MALRPSSGARCLALLSMLAAAAAAGPPPGFPGFGLCPPGTWGIGPMCYGCAKGMYSTGSVTICEACPACYTTMGVNSTSAGSCVCAPGCGFNGTGCSPCAARSYSPGGSAAARTPRCTVCPTGRTTAADKQLSANQCNVCLPGYGGNNCAACRPGFWSAGGNTSTRGAYRPSCTACAAGLTTASTKSTHPANCTLRICAAGQGGNASCPPCPRGTWAAAGSAATPVRACAPCGPNVTTAGSGSASAAACALCLPGFGKVGNLSRCDLCPPNTFSAGGTNTIAKPNCTACPAGMTAAGPGATACVNAGPAPGACTAGSPLCSAQQRCDLTGATANATGGSCRAAFLCPACPPGFECVSTAASLAFSGAMPWCIKKATCDPPCAADEYCQTTSEVLTANYCRKLSLKCGACGVGQICDPVARKCVTQCTAGGNQCAPNPAKPSAPLQFCDASVGLCRDDYCTHDSGNRTIGGCPAGQVCKELILKNGEKQRSCAVTTCSTPCVAPRTCRQTGSLTMECVDARCSPACTAKDETCDPTANKCIKNCGNGPPCAADQLCGIKKTCVPGCSPPCSTDPKIGAVCELALSSDFQRWYPKCRNKCPSRCQAGFYCDKDDTEGKCRPMTCSPGCPAGSTCADIAGQPVCRPNCDPACAAGYACNLTASPPVCVLPNPANFSLVLRISERFQAGDPENFESFFQLDTPVSFLGDSVSGDGDDACHEAVGEGGEDAVRKHGYTSAKWMEAFNVMGVFNDSRGPEGQMGEKWHDVYIDVGGALAAGAWSGKADIKVFARSANVFYENGTLVPPRPLELQVALRHKATGATYAESYTTIGTLGAGTPGEDEVFDYSNSCYRGADALAAMITVTTTPAKDRLAYSLNIAKSYNPGR